MQKVSFYQKEICLVLFLSLLLQARAQPPTTFLRKPFEGDYPASNVFDHNYPLAFADEAPYLLSWWGELLGGSNGHGGYDWRLPKGTEISAAAAGIVSFAGTYEDSDCPFLGNAVSDGKLISLKHKFDGSTYYTTYAHLNDIYVNEGDLVNQGQVIALSGNTGCSLGPHLHFELHIIKDGGERVRVDPYGWQPYFADPWQNHPEGAISIALWEEGHAPKLYGEGDFKLNFVTNTPVIIRRVRYWGVNDDSSPNNEFVELELNPNFNSSEYDLSYHKLYSMLGDVFEFPQGLYLRSSEPIRIYTGKGQNSTQYLYANHPKGIWHNQGDCVALLTPNQQPLFYFWYNQGSCQQFNPE